jgi:hypothetical protein
LANRRIQNSLYQKIGFRGINAQRLTLFYQEFPEFSATDLCNVMALQ